MNFDIYSVVCNRHDVVNRQVIDQFIRLWQCKQFALFIRPTIGELKNAGAVNEQMLMEQMNKTKIMDTNYIFNLILSPVHVFAQQDKPKASFEKLANLIAKLIEHQLMTLEYLNEQTVKLLRIQWNNEV